jgi:hypothetical protein
MWRQHVLKHLNLQHYIVLKLRMSAMRIRKLIGRLLLRLKCNQYLSLNVFTYCHSLFLASDNDVQIHFHFDSSLHIMKPYRTHLVPYVDNVECDKALCLLLFWNPPPTACFSQSYHGFLTEINPSVMLGFRF